MGVEYPGAEERKGIGIEKKNVYLPKMYIAICTVDVNHHPSSTSSSALGIGIGDPKWVTVCFGVVASFWVRLEIECLEGALDGFGCRSGDGDVHVYMYSSIRSI